MITVSILINGKPLYTRSAKNIGPHKINKTSHQYQVDTGEIILHRQDDGAILLAKKLLDTIKET